jgi:hypothetical protein
MVRLRVSGETLERSAGHFFECQDFGDGGVPSIAATGFRANSTTPKCFAAKYYAAKCYVAKCYVAKCSVGLAASRLLLIGARSLLDERSETLEGFRADVMLNSLGVDFSYCPRYSKGQQKVDNQLMPFGTAAGQTATAGGQLQGAVGSGLNQAGSDEAVDDSQGGDMGDSEFPCQVRVAALPAGSNLLGDCLDVIFRLFTGVIAADTAMNDCGGGEFARRPSACSRGLLFSWQAETPGGKSPYIPGSTQSLIFPENPGPGGGAAGT